MSTADPITIPPLAELQARLEACRAEQRELSRLIRMARAATIANKARRERESNREVPHASR